LKIEVLRPKVVKILGLDERSRDDLVWCSASMEVSKLFWIDGLLICMEVPEKSLEYEYEDGVYVISQLCYAKCPRYSRFEDVGRGVQIPVVNATGMRVFEAIVDAIKRLDGDNPNNPRLVKRGSRSPFQNRFVV